MRRTRSGASAFGRLKNEAGLAPIRVRGIERVQLHADLCILATLAQALSRVPPFHSRCKRATTLRQMLERATTRALPLIGRMNEAAPVATGCCNACRSCLATNIIGLAGVALTAATSLIARFARRFVRAS
jgi:hypothetical protein